MYAAPLQIAAVSNTKVPTELLYATRADSRVLNPTAMIHGAAVAMIAEALIQLRRASMLS